MSVTLTDEKHAELVRMLDTIIRGCDARAYDIGLSLDPLRELLGDVAALTRDPAPCPHREALENLSDAYCSAACSDDGAHKVQCSDARAALSQPCAAPGEPSQEDFDGMQRWLDDALRRCRDDDHKRLKYLQADVRILAAARRWVARAAPGEAGDGWELWHCGNVAEDVQFFASQAPKDGPYRVYRRRAPEAKR